MISRVSGKWTMYLSSLQGQAVSAWPGSSGAPTEWRQGMKWPWPSRFFGVAPLASSSRRLRTWEPMWHMIRMLSTT